MFVDRFTRNSCKYVSLSNRLFSKSHTERRQKNNHSTKRRGTTTITTRAQNDLNAVHKRRNYFASYFFFALFFFPLFGRRFSMKDCKRFATRNRVVWSFVSCRDIQFVRFFFISTWAQLEKKINVIVFSTKRNQRNRWMTRNSWLLFRFPLAICALLNRVLFGWRCVCVFCSLTRCIHIYFLLAVTPRRANDANPSQELCFFSLFSAFAGKLGVLVVK